MDGNIILLRQVVSDWIVDGRLSSQAFRPFSGDRLSTYDGDMISPEETYRHYTEVLCNKSAGVFGITCNEVEGQNLGIIEDRVPYREHISVNFQGVGSGGRRSKSRKLASCAEYRGCLYKPD